MVRNKIIVCAVAIIMLIGCFATLTNAATHTIYDNGNLSTTYVTYFKDILSGESILNDYVAFRSGQFSYTLVVGDLHFLNGNFSSNGKVTEYVYSTNSSNYNSTYYYSVNELNTFELSVSNQIIYSNLGQYPHLVERGVHFETFNSVLIVVFMLCIVLNRVFRGR